MHFIFTDVTRAGRIEEGMEQSPYTSFKQITGGGLCKWRFITRIETFFFGAETKNTPLEIKTSVETSSEPKCNNDDYYRGMVAIMKSNLK